MNNDHLFEFWKKNQHEDHEIDIELSGHGDSINGFLVQKGVWDPTSVSAYYYSSYLFYNNARLFAGKTAIDMGTGSGLMGLVMALGGARNVIFTDISSAAVANAQANIDKFNIQDKSLAVLGDLFEKISNKADFIVFNHPFFVGNSNSNDSITTSMLDSGELIKRFLSEASLHLNPGGVVMMPFSNKAGEINDPAVQGPKYGFKVKTVFEVKLQNELKGSTITIHELTL